MQVYKCVFPELRGDCMELSIVRSGHSLRLLLPKFVVAELGWQVDDMLGFFPRKSFVEIRNLKNEKGFILTLFRRRLKKFGGSYAVTIPYEIREYFTGVDSVKSRIENGKIVVIVQKKES